MDNKITATAHDISVGADNGQSPSVTKHTNSITDNNCARNLQSTGTPVGEICLSVHQRLESRF